MRPVRFNIHPKQGEPNKSILMIEAPEGYS
jgi:hypothetical protein